MGLVTGPHAHTPSTHNQWVAGPGRTSQSMGGRALGSAQPRTPPTEARGAPLGAFVQLPQRAKPARKRARCGVGEASPRLHPPHPKPVGGGPRPHAPKDGQSGVGERQTPDAPDPGKKRPPRAPLCCSHSTQSQRARARALGLVTGPHARTPRTHSQWVAGPCRTHQRKDGRPWESVKPRTPHTQARRAPPGRPCAAPTARKASTQKEACPQGDARPQARQIDEGTGPPPRELHRRGTGPRQVTRRGMNRLERPYRRPAPEPRVVRAPHRPGEGEARTPREQKRIHTQQTRGADLKGNRSEPAERTEPIEFRTRRRREGTPGLHNLEHAPREMRGRGGAQGETQEPATAPTPRASCEHGAHMTRELHQLRQ